MNDLNGSRKDERLNLLKKRQDEIDALIEEKERLAAENLELHQQNSELSSMASRLKNKVQEQSQEIVKLNDKIVCLNSSDLQLQEAERIRQETETMISNFRTQADSEWADIQLADKILCERERTIDISESRLRKKKHDLDDAVNRKAEEITNAIKNNYETHKQALDEMYEKKYAGFRIRHYMLLGYGILITLFKGVTSATIRYETTFFITSFFYGIKNIFLLLWNLGGLFARLGDLIPQETIATIVHWFIQIIVTGSVSAVAGYLVFKGVTRFKRVFKQYYMDEVTAMVALVILAVAVGFAEYLTKIPISLIFLCILAFGVYMLIRGLTRWDNEEAKKNLIIWTIGIIVIIALLCLAGAMAESLGL